MATPLILLNLFSKNCTSLCTTCLLCLEKICGQMPEDSRFRTIEVIVGTESESATSSSYAKYGVIDV